MRRKSLLAGGLALGLASGLLVGGCGSSGPSTSAISTVGSTTDSSTTSTLSQSAYIRQADEICAESDAAISAITPGATAAQEAASTTQELQITRDELKSLQTLGAPEGSAPDAFLSALDKVSSQLSRKKLALERGDEAAMPGVDAGIDTAQAHASSAAQAYGFKKCGDFGAPSGTLPTPSGGSANATTSTTSTVPVAPTTTTPVTPTPTTPTTPVVPGGTGTPPTTTTGSGSSGGSGGVGIG